MLEFSPRNIFSPRNTRILQNDTLLGEIDWRKTWGPWAQATITIGGASYTALSDNSVAGTWYLEANNKRLASAEKPSAFRRLFTVNTSGKTYVLKAASVFSGAFLLTKSEKEIGSIAAPRGFFGPTITADLPDYLALEVKAFVIWLVLVASSHSSSGG